MQVTDVRVRKVTSQNRMKAIASIPSREVLLAKLLGSLKAPMSNFAYLIDALIKKQEA